jgi:O-antigen ligase
MISPWQSNKSHIATQERNHCVLESGDCVENYPHDHSRRWIFDYTAAWGLITILVGAVLAFGTVEAWSICAFEVATSLVFLVWMAKAASSRCFSLSNSRAYLPTLLFSCLIAVQLVSNSSAYPYGSHSMALRFVAYGFVFVISVECFREEQLRKWVMVTLIGFGFAYALFAIIQNLTSPGVLYWTVRPTFASTTYGSYVNKNHYAGLMEMLIPMPLVVSTGSVLDGGAKRALLIAAFILMSSTIFLSASRGGMLAFGVEIALFLLLLIYRRVSPLALVGYGLAVSVALVSLVVFTSTGQIASRFQESGPDDRWMIYGDSLKLFLDRPLVGWGLGTFTTVYPHVRSYHAETFVNAAHNDYLQLLVETGLPGLLLVLWFLVAVYRTGLAQSRRWERSWSRSLSVAAMIGCAGLLTHALLDFNMQITANAAFFLFLCGLAARQSDRRSKINNSQIKLPHLG